MSSEKKPALSADQRSVRELMVPLAKYPTLPAWASIKEAVAVMHNTQIDHLGRKSLPRAILVFDLDGSMVGMVRRRDIMRGLEPKFLQNEPLEYRKKLFDVGVDPHLAELSSSNVIHGMQEQAERPITKIVQQFTYTIDANASVITAVYEMVTKSLEFLPVTEMGQVLGVIRTADVFHSLANMVLGDPSTDQK